MGYTLYIIHIFMFIAALITFPLLVLEYLNINNVGHKQPPPTVHNVFFVQFFFPSTERGGTYRKIWHILYHVT